MITRMAVRASDDHASGWADVSMDNSDTMNSIVIISASSMGMVQMSVSDARALKEALNRMFPEV